MRRSNERRAMWWQGAVLALVLCAAAALIAGAALGRMNRDQLKVQVGDLRTFAAAGSVLAEQALAGHTTHRFYRGEASTLNRKVSSAVRELDRAQPRPEIEQDLGTARRLSHAVRDDFTRLSRGLDEQNAGGARDHLRLLAGELRELEERLSS